jgi:peptidoglycan/xylan/chitin deacetylase (PgdA/CDA1 family)
MSTGIAAKPAASALPAIDRPLPNFDSVPTAWPLPLKRHLLHGVYGALCYSGIGAMYVRTRGTHGAVILMYHSVATADQAVWIDPRNHLPADSFERQARFLARHRHVISMSDLVDAIENERRLSAGSVVLTFDDGYLDNLTIAAPILKRCGLPATLYLPTSYIDHGATQWIDRLYTTFRTRRGNRLVTTFDGQAFDLGDIRQRLAAYQHVGARLIVAGLAEREQLLASIEEQLAPCTRPPRLTMTWDDVRHFRRRCPAIEIGVHTCNHLDLSSQSRHVARTEVKQCVADIERELGCRPVHFSYPYSRATTQTRRLVEAAGFRSAVASGSAPLVDVETDRFALPRIAAPSSMTLFRFKTSGAYPGLPLALFGRA